MLAIPHFAARLRSAWRRQRPTVAFTSPSLAALACATVGFGLLGVAVLGGDPANPRLAFDSGDGHGGGDGGDGGDGGVVYAAVRDLAASAPMTTSTVTVTPTPTVGLTATPGATQSATQSPTPGATLTDEPGEPTEPTATEGTPVIQPNPPAVPLYLPLTARQYDVRAPGALVARARGFILPLLAAGREACRPATHVLSSVDTLPPTPVALAYALDPDDPTTHLDLYLGSKVEVRGTGELPPATCSIAPVTVGVNEVILLDEPGEGVRARVGGP